MPQTTGQLQLRTYVRVVLGYRHRCGDLGPQGRKSKAPDTEGLSSPCHLLKTGADSCSSDQLLYSRELSYHLNWWVSNGHL